MSWTSEEVSSRHSSKIELSKFWFSQFLLIWWLFVESIDKHVSSMFISSISSTSSRCSDVLRLHSGSHDPVQVSRFSCEGDLNNLKFYCWNFQIRNFNLRRSWARIQGGIDGFLFSRMWWHLLFRATRRRMVRWLIVA